MVQMNKERKVTKSPIASQTTQFQRDSLLHSMFPNMEIMSTSTKSRLRSLEQDT